MFSKPFKIGRGYSHGGRANKDSYSHGGRANKDSYSHGSRANKASYSHGCRVRSLLGTRVFVFLTDYRHTFYLKVGV